MAKNEKGFVHSALIPLSWEGGNQFMKIKTEASLTFKPSQRPNTCVKQTNDMQNTAQLFSVILHCVKMRKGVIPSISGLEEGRQLFTTLY